MLRDVYIVYGHDVLGVISCDFQPRKHHKITLPYVFQFFDTLYWCVH